jgi:membrane protein DedA with SNARE-associated domain
VLAGPLAGVLRMPRRKFLVFNFLGAVVWVAVISGTGYMFGSNWEHLARSVKNVNVAIAIVAVVALLFFWKQHSASHG